MQQQQQQLQQQQVSKDTGGLGVQNFHHKNRKVVCFQPCILHTTETQGVENLLCLCIVLDTYVHPPAYPLAAPLPPKHGTRAAGYRGKGGQKIPLLIISLSPFPPLNELTC
jgi:hypothetical protein